MPRGRGRLAAARRQVSPRRRGDRDERPRGGGSSLNAALRIGEVAEQVGVTTRTIRYYEERGLLDRGEERAKGAHRTYDEGDVARLRELIRLRDLLGLSLEELIELAEAETERAALRDRWHGDPTDDERRAILDRAVDLVQRQIELVRARQVSLAEFETELREKLESLRLRRRDLGDTSTSRRW